MNNIEWKGIMPAVTTKFTAQDQLDLDMFSVNIKAQLEAGVDGIVLGGTLGEASTLTSKEKRELTITTVKLVNGPYVKFYCSTIQFLQFG